MATSTIKVNDILRGCKVGQIQTVGFMQVIPLIGEVLERFKPDLIHITGPSEIGMLGAGLAHYLKLPLAAMVNFFVVLVVAPV